MSTARARQATDSLLQQSPAGLIDSQRRVAFVAVVDLVHFFDRIEVTDDEGGAERLARLDRLAVVLFDHDDDAARPLAAPGLVDYRRFERQPRQPGAVFAGLLVAQVIGADEVLRRLVGVAPVAKLQIGRKGREELAGGDAHALGAAQVAEVDLAESVPLLMANAARRVVAQ